MQINHKKTSIERRMCNIVYVVSEYNHEYPIKYVPVTYISVFVLLINRL